MPAPPITPLPPYPSRSEDPDNFSNEADAFVQALPAFGEQINDVGDFAETQATAAESAKVDAVAAASTATTQAGIATTQAGNAAASAADSEAFATSVINTADSIGSSTTSNAFSTGLKTFTTQAGKSWVPSMYVAFGLTSDPSKYMIGYVIDYDDSTGQLDVNVVYENHTGTFASWNIFGTSPVDLVNILEPRNVTASTTIAAADDINYNTTGATINQTVQAPVPGAQNILHHVANGTTNSLFFIPATGVSFQAPRATVTDADTLEILPGETLCLAYYTTNIWEIR